MKDYKDYNIGDRALTNEEYPIYKFLETFNYSNFDFFTFELNLKMFLLKNKIIKSSAAESIGPLLRDVLDSIESDISFELKNSEYISKIIEFYNMIPHTAKVEYDIDSYASARTDYYGSESIDVKAALNVRLTGKAKLLSPAYIKYKNRRDYNDDLYIAAKKLFKALIKLNKL